MDSQPLQDRPRTLSLHGSDPAVSEEQGNQQLPSSRSPQQFINRISSDNSIHAECSQQQFLPDNEETSNNLMVRLLRGFEPSRKTESRSIIIPVGGTLSRPIKKKSVGRESLDINFKATLRERNSVMFLSERLCDVHFLVGTGFEQERIPSHSYILAIASNPFDAMFNGDFKKYSEIEIPDVEPDAFKILLKYLYTDEIDIQSDLALPTLYAAKKYLITYLARAVTDFLDANLHADNVCSILSQGRLFEEEDLIKRCWELIDANAEEVLRSDGFLNMDFKLLEQVFSRDTLIVKERSLFEAALRWAKSECARQGILADTDNIRSVLGGVLYLIRFPAMTISDFANGPAKSNLLTCKEANDIFLYFTAEEKPNLPFPTIRRRGLPLYICSRFQTTSQGTNQWRYRGRCDSIQFCVDRRIFVAGYGLYGSSNGPSEYKVNMQLKKGNEILGNVDSSFHSSGSAEAFFIYFPHPIKIEAETQYCASLTIEGKELSHYGQEGMAEVSVAIKDSNLLEEDFVNFFFTPSPDSKNGTGVQGGQLPEIRFYA